MNELEKIRRAAMYLEKLSMGIDPLTDTEIPENDIVSNLRISRCLAYSAGILKDILKGNGRLKIEKTPFSITYEQLSKFEYSEAPITISEIARRLNSLTDCLGVKKISYKDISQWLISVNMLEEFTNIDGKTSKYPTDTGMELGIFTEKRKSIQYNKEYTVVVYNKNAQKFIVDNVYAIMEYNTRLKKNK